MPATTAGRFSADLGWTSALGVRLALHVDESERRIVFPAWVLASAEVQQIPRGVEDRVEPRHLLARTEDFQARTGRSPADFADAWRAGKIEDTPQNARDAIEALALHEALQAATVHA
jgi:hypothetical protein